MQVHPWTLRVVLIPRIKSNPPFSTFSINPHTLIVVVENYDFNYHEIGYDYAPNKSSEETRELYFSPKLIHKS